MHMRSYPTVVVVGGGFCGTLTAIHLARRTRNVRVVLVERVRQRMGRGLAYGTAHPVHLLNVPAARMSAFPDDPEHFLRWARARDDSITPGTFAARSTYGDYLFGLLAIEAGAGRLAAVQGEVVDLLESRVGGPLHVRLKGGNTLSCDRVVLAIGNGPPRDLPLPGGCARLGEPYIADPWAFRALDDIDVHESVVLVGTGLTMYDTVLSLRSRGHQARIIALSRRGLTPLSHAPDPIAAPRCKDELLSMVQSLLAADGIAPGPSLRSIRETARRIESAGGDVRWVIDALRPVTPTLWGRMAEREKERFLVHLRPFWDTHRHRAPAFVAGVIESMRQQGRLAIIAGSVVDRENNGRRLRILFRDRGTAEAGWIEADRLVNCTGPDPDPRRSPDPLLRALVARGAATPGLLGLGLRCTDDGAVVDSSGRPSERIHTIGPLRQGMLWESTAVPELRVQAAGLADTIARSLSVRARPPRASATLGVAPGIEADSPLPTPARRAHAL